ncbi:MAG: hypothetical protein AAF628_17910 [Planctomycetota bacterium]
MSARCGRSDAVLALFLDGDGVTAAGISQTGTGATGGPSRDLAEHLAGCPVCRQQLARARRLDALLAQTSTAAPEPERVELWLAEVAARAASPGPLTVPAPVRRVGVLPLALGAAAMLLVGFFAAVWLRPERSIDGPGETSAAVAVASPTASSDGSSSNGPPRESAPDPAPPPIAGIALPRRGPTPSREARRLRPRPARSAAELVARPVAQLVADLRPLQVLRAEALGLPAVPVTAALQVAADRVRASAVMELAQARQLTPVVAFLAAEPAGPTLDRVAAALREERPLLDRLRHAVRRGPGGGGRRWNQLCRAAAMLGGARLDDALRLAVAGDLGSTESIVEAQSRLDHRPGRVALLLCLWADLEARGFGRHAAAGAPAKDRVHRWFAGLPAAATTDLVAALRQSHHGEERRRCLLALAARGDPAAAPELMARIGGPRYGEAQLAAFALGRSLDASAAAHAVAGLRRGRRPELLLAALASGRAAAAEPWLDALRVTSEERQLLRLGGFDPESFPIAVALCRRGASAP